MSPIPGIPDHEIVETVRPSSQETVKTVLTVDV
jgi:hypothetical protein